MTTRRRLLPIFLLILLLSPTVISGAEDQQQHQAPEPRVKVITRPEWISGQVAVHIFSFPNDGATLQQDTIIVQVAVWGTEQNRPVYIVLDGEEAARIEAPGYYRYEWDLQGSHHITLRDDYTLFKTAQFNIAAPPPPPNKVSESYYLSQLAKERKNFLTFMTTGALLGIAIGAYLKWKTRKFTELALLPFGVFLCIGTGRIETNLYMLIPAGLTGFATYCLIRDYTEAFVLGRLKEGLVDSHNVIDLDENDEQLVGIGVRYWREGFVKRRKIKFKELQRTTFHLPDGIYPGVIVKEKEELENGTLVITCDNSLIEMFVNAHALEETKKLLKKTQRELAEERAIGEVRRNMEIEKEKRKGTRENIEAIFKGRGI